MTKAITVVLSALLLSGCGQLGQADDRDRYTVVQAGPRTILLDTREGRAWELSLDQQGAARGWAAINSLPTGVR
jgi:hypothetical protein